MEPIEITTWKCPICNTVYESKDDAIACSSKPNPTPRFSVGDKVYMQVDHPEDDAKPFVKRTITSVCGVFKDVADRHVVGYALDYPIYKGDYYVGDWSEWRPEDGYPALEDDLYALGDQREMWKPKILKWEMGVLTEEMVDGEEKL